ncbi:MAG: thioredoxin domain-containing protein [Candidatus Aenigmarchaeota archaeon]|nr:thioredoxin domain-containing protein [Candidatus Aenigmarchaeota archaeon]
MEEEKKSDETKEETKTDEKKENILVIKKSTVFIIAAVIVIFIVGIIGLRMAGFFNGGNNTTNGVEMIASDSPILGDSDADVFLVEFSDYECPYCQAAEGTNFQVISRLKQSDPLWEAPIPKVIEEYVDTGKVKLVFRQYPIHENAKKAAEAAKCAQEQDKFWDYHEILFEKYEALSATDLKKYAADLELDLNQFNQCLDSGKYKNSVENDMNDGRSLGVSGTPTFFIGNEEKGYEKIVGAESFSEFKGIIDLKISV